MGGWGSGQWGDDKYVLHASTIFFCECVLNAQNN